MEKQIKNSYNVSCNWYMQGREEDTPLFVAESWSTDAKGNDSGSWTGKLIAYDDNSCVGYATDKGKDKPNHLLIGTILDGKAFSLCKINAQNFIYDPILFHTFSNSLANNMGNNDSYYGEFFSKTLFEFARLGCTSLKAEPRAKDQQEIEKIKSIYDAMAKKIRESGTFGAMTLEQVESLDQEQTNRYMNDFAAQILHADLPIELQQEIFTQMGK